MSLGEWAKKKAKQIVDSQVEKGNAERNIHDLSKPVDRQLNLNPQGKKLEWMDAVDLYECEYAQLRLKYGWKMVKGWEFRRESNRFLPVRWKVGETIVEARYLSMDGNHVGIVQEKVIKK